MAAKKPVNLANLEALGAKRLAELLLELGTEDAAIKRRLRLELSAETGAEVIAADIGRRLTTLRQARSFIDWQKRPAFVKDLDLQRQLIVDKVADSRPDLALELLWRFLELAEPVLNRVDDSRAAIATRLLAAGRAEEALVVLKEGAPAESSARDLKDAWALSLAGTGADAWDQAWVAALLATGRQDEAQRFRWARFEARLDAVHLARLPRGPAGFRGRAGGAEGARACPSSAAQ
jgi:hypothetical protein